MRLLGEHGRRARHLALCRGPSTRPRFGSLQSKANHRETPGSGLRYSPQEPVYVIVRVPDLPQGCPLVGRMQGLGSFPEGGWRSPPYRLRKQVVEPVFGQIKQAMGFRQFLLGGLAKVQAGWGHLGAVPK